MHHCFKQIALTLLATSGIMLSSVVSAQPEPANLSLTACHVEGIKSQMQCGTLTVPENYQLPQGNTININFVRVPAIDNHEHQLPFVFLAGGPGQAAVELAAPMVKLFKKVRYTHDIIFIDQRGTGKSHPLQCNNVISENAYQMLPENFSQQDVKTCLATLTGDLSQYNSENAVRDFNAVRVALGYQQWHVYGGSYGTRAALVYLHLFPATLRSVVLDSVAPLEIPIGLFGQSGAQSFTKLLTHCQQNKACHQAFPALASEFNQLIARVSLAPIQVKIPHPRLGTPTDFVISRTKLLGEIRMQLYSVQMRSLVPLVIHQAYLGNYLPLAGLIAQSDGNTPMYLGLTLNIMCNEDFPRITPAMFAADANNNFDGDNSVKILQQSCPIWPQYRPSAQFYQPVTANVPTLILSGGLDPVTPPSNGVFLLKTLPDSHQIIVENSAHIVASHSCAPTIISEFITTLNPKKLDESCLKNVPEETFMTSLNGSL